MFFGKSIQVTTPKGFLRVGYGLMVAGIIMFMVACYNYENEKSFIKTAQHATGTVINMIESINNSSSGSNTTYTPVVKFVVDGHEYTFTSNTGTNPPEYQQGQRVDVIYAQHDPTNANINDNLNNWGGALIFAGIGVFCILFGAIFAIFRNKIKSNSNMDMTSFRMFNQQNNQF